MSARRTYKWDTHTGDVVAVMRAIAPIVHASGQKLPSYVKTDGYVLSGGTTRLDETKDLEDAVQRLPEPPAFISLAYTTSLSAAVRNKPYYSIRLEVVLGKYKYVKAAPDATVSVDLEITGPDTNETFGLMDQMQARIVSEIKRQDAENWTAPPIALNAMAGRSLVAGDQRPSEASLWKKSRKWIAGIITAVIASVVAALIHDHLSGKPPVHQPPPAFSTTITTPPPTKQG